MIDGTAGAMEPLQSFYAKGGPQHKSRSARRPNLTTLTNVELRARLVAALQALSYQC